MANKNLSNVAKIAAICAVAVGILVGARSIWVRDSYQEATALNSAGVTVINGNGHIVDEAAKDGFVEEFIYKVQYGRAKEAPVENANNPAPSATIRPFRTETAVNVANVTANDVKDAPVENGSRDVTEKENEDVQQLTTDDNGVGKPSWGEVNDVTVENGISEQIPMGEFKDAPVENGWGYVLIEGKENEYVQELATGENEKLAEELKDDRISDVDAVGDGVGQEKVPKIPGTRSETTEIVYDINELQDTNELIAPEPAKADNTPYLIGGGVLAAVLLGGGYVLYRFKRQNPEQKQ